MKQTNWFCCLQVQPLERRKNTEPKPHGSGAFGLLAFKWEKPRLFFFFSFLASLLLCPPPSSQGHTSGHMWSPIVQCAVITKQDGFLVDSTKRTATTTMVMRDGPHVSTWPSVYWGQGSGLEWKNDVLRWTRQDCLVPPLSSTCAHHMGFRGEARQLGMDECVLYQTPRDSMGLFLRRTNGASRKDGGLTGTK